MNPIILERLKDTEISLEELLSVVEDSETYQVAEVRLLVALSK